MLNVSCVGRPNKDHHGEVLAMGRRDLSILHFSFCYVVIVAILLYPCQSPLVSKGTRVPNVA